MRPARKRFPRAGPQPCREPLPGAFRTDHRRHKPQMTSVARMPGQPFRAGRRRPPNLFVRASRRPRPSVAFCGDGRNGHGHHDGGDDGRLLRAGRLLREGGRRAPQGEPVARACGCGPGTAGPRGPEAVRFGASGARAGHGHSAGGRARPGSRRGRGRSWMPGTPLRQRCAPIAHKPHMAFGISRPTVLIACQYQRKPHGNPQGDFPAFRRSP